MCCAGVLLMGVAPRIPGGGGIKEFASIFVRGHKHEAMPIASVRAYKDKTVKAENLYLGSGPYFTDPKTWTVNNFFKVQTVAADVYVYILQDAKDSSGSTYHAGDTLASYNVNSDTTLFLEKIFYPLPGKSWS